MSARLCVAGPLARLIGDGAGVGFRGDPFAQPVTRRRLPQTITLIRRRPVAILALSGGWLLAGACIEWAGSGLLALPAGVAAAEAEGAEDGDHLVKPTYTLPRRRHPRG
ncbi:hypothetical protein [Nonomuraea sp. NPDC049480]|uniref:hypothetical protein n=1 Tax=Nonomuraea sp. NPDC049480 TaxID=3364353 RepID=UPI0037B726A7